VAEKLPPQRESNVCGVEIEAEVHVIHRREARQKPPTPPNVKGGVEG